MTDNAEAQLTPPLSTVETIGALAVSMGIEIHEASPQRLVGTMPVEGNTQPLGLLHGGASAVLAETLGSIGAHLAALPDRTAVGVDLSITHHTSMREGTVRGVATAIAIGRTLACYEIEIYGEDVGRRVATARLTCLLRSLPSRGA